MGYYSYFRFSLPYETQEVEDEIANALEEKLDICLEEPNKWYDFERDMTDFSKLFPQYIFEFIVEGEERDDT